MIANVGSLCCCLQETPRRWSHWRTVARYGLVTAMVSSEQRGECVEKAVMAMCAASKASAVINCPTLPVKLEGDDADASGKGNCDDESWQCDLKLFAPSNRFPPKLPGE